jgi:hypothetical protein
MTQNELLSEELQLRVEQLITVGLRQNLVEFTAFFAGFHPAKIQVVPISFHTFTKQR